jgi:hypothetical protein
MNRLRRAIDRARTAIVSPFVVIAEWQAEIPAEGRVVLVGLLILGAGLGAVWPPLAAIIPGSVVVSIGVGVNFRHPITAAVLIAGATAVAIAAIATSAG